MFALKRMCKDCPFRKDGTMNRSLDSGRMEEIIDSLHSDKIFSCHKTIDYSKINDTDEQEYKHQDDNQFCAGSMLYLLKEQAPNQPMQIAERLGIFDSSSLNGMEDVIDIIPMEMPWERLRKTY